MRPIASQANALALSLFSKRRKVEKLSSTYNTSILGVLASHQTYNVGFA